MDRTKCALVFWPKNYKIHYATRPVISDYVLFNMQVYRELILWYVLFELNLFLIGFKCIIISNLFKNKLFFGKLTL